MAKRFAIFMPATGGGVERMLINLAGGIAARGVRVDLLTQPTANTSNDALLDDVRLVTLNGQTPKALEHELAAYLVREKPIAALASKLGAADILIDARRRAQSNTRVVVRVATTVSAAYAHQGFIKRWRMYRTLRRAARASDALIAVSHGVARDVAEITRLPRTRIHVIPNPVVTTELARLATGPVMHPWYTARTEPIVIGVGRFSRAKDFPTLVHAFARLRAQRPCRLVIVGDGRQRPAIERLVARLNLEQSAWLPGYVANPYPYVAAASLFVLSSRWEGSPNVLTEALALGCPVIATDCMSGPREILQDGRYGKLVPVGDIAALAQAMATALDEPPPDPGFLKSAVSEYTVERAAAHYLEVLLGVGETRLTATSGAEQPAPHPGPLP